MAKRKSKSAKKRKTTAQIAASKRNLAKARAVAKRAAKAGVRADGMRSRIDDMGASARGYKRSHKALMALRKGSNRLSSKAAGLLRKAGASSKQWDKAFNDAYASVGRKPRRKGHKYGGF